VHVSFGRLTENAIPKTPVQNSVRCILAQLILVEKHGQHLGKKAWLETRVAKDAKTQRYNQGDQVERWRGVM
jgi:hypothetical protein